MSSPSAEDRFGLQRFLQAQDPVYAQVVAELRDGRKASHWMWFVFPQLQGLGRSDMARRYAISGCAEAAAYLAHPLLGARLRECTALVNAVQGRGIQQILGSPDDLKFHSCMTLFEAVAPQEPLFGAAIARFFGGRRDAQTLARL
ncbi:DUF1810 domain-containing protein [uncultured Piscinibacter sp.]|uniref:DUF1810 domain-containing protein n=1 Tax=uncultured Piscinibacter sp. TaxID=1131835 RepID=UPI0026060414|nr:DUF1810 domain-containing protein [uncultured Piscinibacter sp.]